MHAYDQKIYEKKNNYCWNDFLLVSILFSWWLLIYFLKKKFPIIWSKRKRRTDDGIESITNCLYVKCNAKNTTTSKKIMNYKKWLFIAGFLYSLFRYGLGIFFREMKRCRKLHFFFKMHSWRLLSCCKAFFLEFYQIFLFYIPVRNKKLLKYSRIFQHNKNIESCL